MNNFEKFISLPLVTQRRIIRQARQIDAATMHRVEFYGVADALTEAAYQRRHDRATQREELARYRWPDSPPKSGTY